MRFAPRSCSRGLASLCLLFVAACASETSAQPDDDGESGADASAPPADDDDDHDDDDDDDDEPGGGDGTSSGGDPEAGSGSSGSGDDVGDSGEADSSDGGIDSGAATETGSDDGRGDDAGADTGRDGVPNGGECSDDPECASNQCFEAGPLGGVCGECNDDDDCPDGGCTPPNPLTSAPSVCNDGGYGSGCESSEVCQGDLVCEVVIDIPGIIETATCGECGARAPCAGVQLCEPTYSIFNLSGVWGCVGPGSLDNGEGCNLAGDGSACASGLCAAANYNDILLLGVCSECDSDDDCAGGSCELADIGLAGLVPGHCV